jgi:transposase-like protein
MLYCPKCKSDQVTQVAGGYMGQVYLCKKCGYRGSFILEVDPLPGGEEPENR